MNACGPNCGFCGRCEDGDHAERDFRESCSHPLHWRSLQGACRLCDASAETIVKQGRQRSLAQGVTELDSVRRG